MILHLKCKDQMNFVLKVCKFLLFREKEFRQTKV